MPQWAKIKILYTHFHNQADGSDEAGWVSRAVRIAKPWQSKWGGGTNQSQRGQSGWRPRQQKTTMILDQKMKDEVKKLKKIKKSRTSREHPAGVIVVVGLETETAQAEWAVRPQRQRDAFKKGLHNQQSDSKNVCLFFFFYIQKDLRSPTEDMEDLCPCSHKGSAEE